MTPLILAIAICVTASLMLSLSQLQSLQAQTLSAVLFVTLLGEGFVALLLFLFAALSALIAVAKMAPIATAIITSYLLFLCARGVWRLPAKVKAQQPTPPV